MMNMGHGMGMGYHSRLASQKAGLAVMLRSTTSEARNLDGRLCCST